MLIQSNGSCLTRSEPLQALINSSLGCGKTMHRLAPIITKIFNHFIMHQSVPTLWKNANVRPIPKESPITESTQFRPISLTDVIMRLWKAGIQTRNVNRILSRPLTITNLDLRRVQHYFSPLKMSKILVFCKGSWLWLCGRVVLWLQWGIWHSIPEDYLWQAEVY